MISESTLPEASVRSTNIARDPWLSWYLIVDYARNSPGARPLQSSTVKKFCGSNEKPWKFNNTQNFHANYIVCSKLDLVYCEICKRDFFLFILLFFPLFSSNLSQLVCISRGIQCIARSLTSRSQIPNNYLYTKRKLSVSSVSSDHRWSLLMRKLLTFLIFPYKRSAGLLGVHEVAFSDLSADEKGKHDKQQC